MYNLTQLKMERRKVIIFGVKKIYNLVRERFDVLKEVLVLKCNILNM